MVLKVVISEACNGFLKFIRPLYLLSQVPRWVLRVLGHQQHQQDLLHLEVRQVLEVQVGRRHQEDRVDLEEKISLIINYKFVQ